MQAIEVVVEDWTVEVNLTTIFMLLDILLCLQTGVLLSFLQVIIGKKKTCEVEASGDEINVVWVLSS